MVANKRNWLPPWPVVPPRLWLTAAATMVVGLSIIFENEIMPNHPKAQLWSWVVLGVLVQVGGVQVLSMLRAWLRAYHGPGVVRLLMWGIVLPAYVVLSPLLLFTCVFTCYGLVSALAG
ncbi:hypothetical protein ACFP2F_12505 [Hymenobacter artigasi]|uniref:Uncharacterized protein n=1 Tax=Hymenobacter artigasi TaxID=2719616 RepID=A0ABX1HDE4_9BACT|nr:hypothetical protein [Hymenobacter artigasi]NKI88263.1 hypothetical protein [Hymenobacter artigasi]